MKEGHRPDLVGGGLIRSMGGWVAVKGLLSQGIRVKGDERILGGSAFVEEVLRSSEEQFEKRTLFKSKGADVEKLLLSVTQYYEVDVDDIKSGSRVPDVAKARSVFCHLAVRGLGESGVNIAKMIGLSQSAVSKAMVRGKAISKDENLEKKLLIS